MGNLICPTPWTRSKGRLVHMQTRAIPKVAQVRIEVMERSIWTFKSSRDWGASVETSPPNEEFSSGESPDIFASTKCSSALMVTETQSAFKGQPSSPDRAD